MTIFLLTATVLIIVAGIAYRYDWPAWPVLVVTIAAYFALDTLLTPKLWTCKTAGVIAVELPATVISGWSQWGSPHRLRMASVAVPAGAFYERIRFQPTLRLNGTPDAFLTAQQQLSVSVWTRESGPMNVQLSAEWLADRLRPGRFCRSQMPTQAAEVSACVEVCAYRELWEGEPSSSWGDGPSEQRVSAPQTYGSTRIELKSVRLDLTDLAYAIGKFDERAAEGFLLPASSGDPYIHIFRTCLEQHTFIPGLGYASPSGLACDHQLLKQP